jgi:hypothetical protein
VTDGVPSAPRSSGRSPSRRVKNCSVKRTCRSGTLTAALLAELDRRGLYFGPERFRHVVPGFCASGFDGFGTLLWHHRRHFGSRNGFPTHHHGSECTWW